jgi:hypothetical protein
MVQHPNRPVSHHLLSLHLAGHELNPRNPATTLWYLSKMAGHLSRIFPLFFAFSDPPMKTLDFVATLPIITSVVRHGFDPEGVIKLVY